MNRAYDLPLQEGQQPRSLQGRYLGRRGLDHALVGRHPVALFVLRALLYITITAGVLQSLVYATPYLDAESFFAENGAMEWLQFGLLVVCAVLLKLASARARELREALYVMALLPVAAGVRELDHALDTRVFDGAWQILVSALLLYIVFYALQHQQALRRQLLYIFSYPPTGLLISGFIAVMVFSRLLGQQIFWQFVLQVDYLRLVGRVVEESCELFGYLLLLFGCLEFFIFSVWSGRHAGHAASRRE